MRSLSTRALSVLLVAASASVACGGSSNDGTAFPGGGGADGGDLGGASSGGGKGGASNGGGDSGGGGTSNGGVTNGGTANGGGGTGNGGAPVDGGTPCPAPTVAGQTNLCVHVAPEDLNFRTERQVDGKGVFIIQVFAIPNPPDQGADKIALAQTVLPQGAALGSDAGAEISITEIPDLQLSGTFPDTVYVRAIFVDNPDAIGRGTPGFGTWIGGLDLSKGLVDKEPLTAVHLTVGAGNSLNLPLTALRLLRVTFHLAATPLGDGQGPLSFIAVDDPDPTTSPNVFGIGARACADVSAGDVTINGVVIGGGPLYVVGILDDFGLNNGQGIAPGSVSSLVVNGASITIPTQIGPKPKDYAFIETVNLGHVEPYDVDGGIPPNSCLDLAGGGADAGP